MHDVARVLAVCDLLADARSSLDAESVMAAGAEQLARLTRADLAIVAAEVDGGLVGASYPRPVATSILQALVADHWEARGESGGILRTGGEDRVAGFGHGRAMRGAVATIGPIDGSFSSLDEWLVMVAAQRVAAQLELVELHRQRLSDSEIVRDAALAGDLQRALMPPAEQRIGPIDIAGRLLPARHVGGDLYDLYVADGAAIGVVADVAGKGAPASLLTAAVSGAARHAVEAIGPEPAGIIYGISREIRRLLDRTDRIVTVAVVAIDASGRELRIASAGQSPLVVRSGGRVRLSEPGGPPLGTGSHVIPESVLAIGPGDFALLASDGIIDQRRPDGATYGVERLLATLDQRPLAAATDILETVYAGVREFAAGAPQDDDQTGLAMLVVGAAR